MLPRIDATRYVTPLREGGSLPGIVEASDLGTYVMKLYGAGQGTRVLVAEVVVAGIARALGLRAPELATVTLSTAIAKYEADQEVQELLNASIGLNLGIDFLPGSFGFDSHTAVGDEEAATIMWLDAFTANVDRSWRNPNLLVWHGQIWCIDHGAALYFHHLWPNGVSDPRRFAQQPYDVSEHVLSGRSGAVAELDPILASKVTSDLLEAVVADVPDEWLAPVPGAPTAHEQRALYVEFLLARLAGRQRWLPERAKS